MGIQGLNEGQLQKAIEIAKEEGCRIEMKGKGSFDFVGAIEAETKVSIRIQKEILGGVATM